MFFIFAIYTEFTPSIYKKTTILKNGKKRNKTTKFCFKLDLFSEVERKCETNTVKD